MNLLSLFLNNDVASIIDDYDRETEPKENLLTEFNECWDYYRMTIRLLNKQFYKDIPYFVLQSKRYLERERQRKIEEETSSDEDEDYPTLSIEEYRNKYSEIETSDDEE